MANPPTEAVLVGSKAFALALFAPLTERAGTRPRIAADPGQALALCKGGGLVVVEFQGEGSLRAIQALVVQEPGVRAVAAVPAAHAAAEAPLRALGVELARWDGTPEPVLEAIVRQLGAGDAASPSGPAPAAAAHPSPPPPPPAPVPAATPAGAGAPPRRPSVDWRIFDDLGPEEVEPAPDAGLAAPPAAPAPARADAGTPWPGNTPSALDAAEALARGLAGSFDPPGTPLAAVSGVLGSLTELERAVLAGAPQPVDAEPIRRAAVMRVRVAAALAMAPGPGVPVDRAATSALLAEIDGLLASVNALAQSTPPELLPAVEQVRNSLVKEAIDFSEAAHGGAPPAAEPERAAPRGAGRGRRAAVAARAEADAVSGARRERRRIVAAAVALALALAAAGWVAWQYWTHLRR